MFESKCASASGGQISRAAAKQGQTPRCAGNSHRIRRHEAADDDAAAVMHVPHHGLTDRIATIADDGPLGYRHPLPLDGNPIGRLAKFIVSAMSVSDIA